MAVKLRIQVIDANGTEACHRDIELDDYCSNLLVHHNRNAACSPQVIVTLVTEREVGSLDVMPGGGTP